MTAVIRPRGQWEAVDFGITLARHWRRPLWAAWLATVAPLWWLVYGVLTATAGPWIALLVLWWLRPLFSRVPLLVLSRALFGEVVSARAAVGEVPRLWLRNLVADLTLRRVDLARSFHLPVYQLEGLAGRTRRRRLAVLRQDRHAAAAGLTAVAMLIEASLFLAALALVAQLVPAGFAIDWWSHLASLFAGEAAGWFLTLIGFCAFVALSLAEPFYVAGGFGLYLDRRIHLEGWDVELAFRRLARRLAGERRVAALLVALLLAAGAASAAETPSETVSGQKSRAAFDKPPSAAATPPAAAPRDPALVIGEVLSDPAFATRRQVEGWQLKKDLLARLDGLEDRQRKPLTLPVGLLARLGEIALWTLAIVLLAALVVGVARHARLAAGPRRRHARAPGELRFGFDPTAESLPADPVAVAGELFAAGRATEALGLLYRSALARLAHHREVAASWTEEECVRRLADQLEGDGAGWFRRLAVAWQAAAYGHREPDAEAFAELSGGWRRQFEPGRLVAPQPETIA
ncbi:MAG TPA: DUF4129 domain-containing protein [Thermoanaerobaculia bacterium]|nr:DUF4129 domain-containing protein [Thermoanaerobaculia bacterium]